MRTIVDHQGRLNVAFVASRILLEAAICECPLSSGRSPGNLDISWGLARANQAYNLGNWSDAIHWGAMEPRLRITPLGDVHSNHDFVEEVYERFGRSFGEDETRRAADSYSKIYEPAEVLPTVKGVLEDDFLDAWKAEFGTSLDGVRAFMDDLDEHGRRQNKALIEFPRSALRELLRSAAGISLGDASVTLAMLTLEPRVTWRTVGSEFKDKDWFPWRFRRRLSVLRRPFIQLDGGADPTILVAPGLIREAVILTARLFHDGGIASSQARSPAMCRWIGRANNLQRSGFNSTVANRMRELGWEVRQENKLTKILEMSLDRDYGDIDVLAWRPESGRVLAMECKDLQFHKTLGEVAEQLADFRGKISSDGKPDNLRRHLDRLDVLRTQEVRLSKVLKLASPIQLSGHLVFKNLVPMRFAWNEMTTRIQLSLFDELDHLR